MSNSKRFNGKKMTLKDFNESPKTIETKSVNKLPVLKRSLIEPVIKQPTVSLSDVMNEQKTITPSALPKVKSHGKFVKGEKINNNFRSSYFESIGPDVYDIPDYKSFEYKEKSSEGSRCTSSKTISQDQMTIGDMAFYMFKVPRIAIGGTLAMLLDKKIKIMGLETKKQYTGLEDEMTRDMMVSQQTAIFELSKDGSHKSLVIDLRPNFSNLFREVFTSVLRSDESLSFDKKDVRIIEFENIQNYVMEYFSA